VAIVATGFAAGERPDHWKRHGYEFPELVDEFEYEQLAMAFLNERLDPTKVHECVRRRDSDTIRHEPGTENFAVMRGRGDTNLLPTAGWMAQIEQQFSLLPTRVLPMKYYCPVCGYDQLDAPAANHKICPCCGTHFAYDDVGHTWADLREAWLLRGTPWFSVAIAPPPEWNPLRQLEQLRSPALQSRHQS
jgi:hypothetical protein